MPFHQYLKQRKAVGLKEDALVTEIKNAILATIEKILDEKY
jgi:hypothetical protein